MIKKIFNHIKDMMNTQYKVAPIFEDRKDIIPIAIKSNNLLTSEQERIISHDLLRDAIVSLTLSNFKRYPGENIKLIQGSLNKKNFFLSAEKVNSDADIIVEINDKTIMGMTIIINNYNVKLIVCSYKFLDVLKNILNERKL